VARRLLPALLVVVAAAADVNGAHGLARAALLGAVPLATVAAIAAFGECLDDRDTAAAAQAVLSSLVVACLVMSCAIRSNAVQGVPQAAVSSLFAALGILASKAFLAVAPQMRRLSELWPAKP